SCASSSAVARSPTMRASRAMSRAESIRQIASIARFASAAPVARLLERSGVLPFRTAMARGPSHALGLEDLTDLEGPAVVWCPLQPFKCLIERAHLPQPVSGHELLRLRNRPV